MKFEKLFKEQPIVKPFLGLNNPIAAFDIESELDATGNWVFKVASVAYDNEVTWYYDVKSLHEKLLELKVPAYAHNLDFDVLFFMREPDLLAATQDAKIISSGNKIIAIKLAGVEFRNSLVLLPMSLLKVVKKFLLVDDQAYFDDKNNVTQLNAYALKYYCAKDSGYLLAALNKYINFVSSYGCKLKYTTPSTALSIFCGNFNDHDFIKDANRHKFFDTGYYFGGHSEKFVAGQKVFRHCYYYDINSLYPHVMQNFECSTGKLVKVKPDITQVKRLVRKNTLFFGEFLVNINSEELRFFPVLDDVKHLNKYPTGLHWLKLSEVAIKFILKYGSWKNICDCRELLIYEDEEKIKPFEAYVDHFYAVRKSGNGYEEVAKLLLNSLYGKFGERLLKQSKTINPTTEPTNMVSFEHINGTANVVTTHMEKISKYKTKFNRFDIAGKITESARLLMADYINQCRQYGKVYYTDTDSVITNFPLELSPLKHLVDENQLGLFKNEEYNQHCIIIGVKMYHFYRSGKTARKGIKNMGLAEFRELIRGRKEFTNERFSKMYSLVNKGFFGIQITPYEIHTILERLD